MRKNNNKAKSIPTYNYEGEPSYMLSSGFFSENSKKPFSPPPAITYSSTSLELAAIAFSSLVEDTFYEKWDEREKRLNEKIDYAPADFIAKLAVFSRREMNLRAFPIYLLLTAIKKGIHKKNPKLFRSAIANTINRADELSEFLAVYQKINGKIKPLANIVKKGIADAFKKFDEYQFAKYKRERAIVTLKDALYLTHPKPETKEQSELFKKIKDNKLNIPYTWEVKLSEIPADDIEGRREFWKDIISKRKLGYMAALRNLRNILKVADDELVEMISVYIKDKNLLVKSRIFPFRLLSAYKEINLLLTQSTEWQIDVKEEHIIKILQALKDAVEVSLGEVMAKEEFWQRDERTLVAIDVSGSMDSSISVRSRITLKDISIFYGILAKNYLKDSKVGLFGYSWKMVDELIDDNIFASHDRLSKVEVGCSTNGYLAIKWLLDNKVKVDRIIMFTDCQLWDSSYYLDSESNIFGKLFYNYKKVNPKVKLYIFDLAGYGTTPVDVREGGVYFISGYSDKIFQAISYIEKGEHIVKMINKYEF